VQRCGGGGMEFRSVYITFANSEEAQRIGRLLVAERLAACVNFFPVQSIYRWQDEIEQSDEVSLIAKTRAENVEPLIHRVKELHSYQNPCIVSWPIERGSPAFLDWIRDSTERA
jgi:periplasmic divalent cation tolerance protein